MVFHMAVEKCVRVPGGSTCIKLNPNAKYQIPEEKLKAPPKKCFVSLQDVVSSSCLTFDNQIYFKTSEEIFIIISGNNKSVSGNKCFVQIGDIIVKTLPEYLNNDINLCSQTSCRPCNIFISNQVF